MTIGVDDLEPEPEPDRVPEQLRNPAQSLPELGPLPEPVPLPYPVPLPEFVPLDVPVFVPLPELVFVPLPEVDVAELIAHLAREADDMALFVAEHAAREADPSHWAELLAGIAERDAELARWAAGAP